MPDELMHAPSSRDTDTTASTSRDADIVLAYHERTKHRLERYAAGPETLDWTAQPDPFREYRGARRLPLPLSADRLAARFADGMEARAARHDSRDGGGRAKQDSRAEGWRVCGLGDLYVPGAIDPQPFSRDSLGALLQLSMAISAWKEYGPDRWALRCNPSSGNLHPTEAYVICHRVPGLDDGLYHYTSRDHALEQRCAYADTSAAGGLWIGLASIHWREAWKYGERAFRYCQLDVGHALGALRYAAAVLGWTLRLADAGTGELAALLGLDRDADYVGAEREEPDLLLQVLPGTGAQDIRQEPQVPHSESHHWTGQANLLDPHPMYHWPVIGEVASATSLSRDPRLDSGMESRATGQGCTGCGFGPIGEVADATSMSRDPRLGPIGEVTAASRQESTTPGSLSKQSLLPVQGAEGEDDGVEGDFRDSASDACRVPYPPLADGNGEPAARVILNRRSAQRFDARSTMSSGQFYRLLDCLLPRPIAPWDLWPHAPRLHPILFVHRIEGLEAGLYALPRRPEAEKELRAALRGDFAWERAADCPAHLPLYRLLPGDCRAAARTLSCHQAIAADGCFSVAMLAEFESLVRSDPWRYRQLHWEAGLLGQVLYLEAEAAGLRGTGIGCYFDDAVHEILGLRDARFQSLYHFTVGRPLTDERITTSLPYPQRVAQTTEDPT